MTFNRKENWKAYYAKHREEILEKHHNYNHSPEGKLKRQLWGKQYNSRIEIKRYRAKQQVEYVDKNKEKLIAYRKKYYAKPEIMHRQQVYSNNYYRLNKKKIDEYQRAYRPRNREIFRAGYLRFYHKHKEEAKYALAKRMTNRINKILAHRKQGRKWESIVGYSKDELVKHLFGNIIDGNYEINILKEGKHINHKTPLCFFEYETENDKLFKKAWSLENLQLIDKKENLIKNKHYVADVLLALSQIGRC
jgi:hypothetical protein